MKEAAKHNMYTNGEQGSHIGEAAENPGKINVRFPTDL